MPLRDTKDTPVGTFTIALILCVACSVLVSAAAVALKPSQDRQKELFKKKNIVLAAGYGDKIESGQKIDDIFEKHFTFELIDLETGKNVTDEKLAELGISEKTNYDPLKAAKDPAIAVAIKPTNAMPGLTLREPLTTVYTIVEEEETVGYVFPVYGKGLWSTLYGFLAVEADGETVRGITFYDHAETPGLGGEVDNPNWKAKWTGKKVYGEDGKVALSVIKGTAVTDTQIDGLSGATITSNGVDKMVKYWLGPTAYGPFLESHKK